MDSQNRPGDSAPKGPEKKTEKRPGAPLGNNTFLILLLTVVGMIVVVQLFGASLNRYEIPYSDLVRLIDQGGKPDAEIEVKEGAGKHIRSVKYTLLSNYSQETPIKVGEDEISGKIDRLVVSADGERKPPKESGVYFFTPRKGLEGDRELFERLRKNDIRFEGEEAPSFMKIYGPMFLFSALIALVFIYFVRKQLGNGSPMAFGRSRGRMYAQEDIGVTFEDVAGINEAVEELREVVEFLKTPEKYQTLGGRIPKGVLLVGPPGTGKTLLAKAIAGEAGVPFFSLSGSDFVEMFVGVGAARVRDMFSQAEAKAPCIIFIDELDALGKTRGGSVVGGHDEREQTLNALLVEMDGFDSNSGVIVMAATNRPETLDPALLRPGRFDRHVLVDRPDILGREAILKVHVQNVKLAENVSLKEIARITSGFVGADLANLVNEAALLAARNGKTAVTMEEFDEGVERVTAGLEKKQRVMHADEKLRVAHHESGHALVAYSLPNTMPVHKVSIIPRGLAALGYVMQRPEGDRFLLTKGELESRIKVALAGTVSEELVYNETSTGAQNDLERATDLARQMVMEFGMSRLGRVAYRESGRSPFLSGGGAADFPRQREHSEQTAREIDEEVKYIIDQSITAVRHILQTRRKALDALAKCLMDKEVIDAEELKKVIEENSPSPMIVPGTEGEPKPAILRPAAPMEGGQAAT